MESHGRLARDGLPSSYHLATLFILRPSYDPSEGAESSSPPWSPTTVSSFNKLLALRRLARYLPTIPQIDESEVTFFPWSPPDSDVRGADLP